MLVNSFSSVDVISSVDFLIIIGFTFSEVLSIRAVDQCPSLTAEHSLCTDIKSEFDAVYYEKIQTDYWNHRCYSRNFHSLHICSKQSSEKLFERFEIVYPRSVTE